MDQAMINRDQLPFVEACGADLTALLATFGFKRVGEAEQMYGVIIEYRRENDLIFIGCEGGVLDADLIRQDSNGAVWRIDLPKSLWFNGMRGLVIPGQSCCQQLAYFVSHAPLWTEFLKSPWTVDSRMCFPFVAPNDYLNWQRGIRADHSRTRVSAGKKKKETKSKG